MNKYFVSYQFNNDENNSTGFGMCCVSRAGPIQTAEDVMDLKTNIESMNDNKITCVIQNWILLSEDSDNG